MERDPQSADYPPMEKNEPQKLVAAEWAAQSHRYGRGSDVSPGHVLPPHNPAESIRGDDALS